MARKNLKTDKWVCDRIIVLMAVSCLIDLCIKADWFAALVIVTDDFQSAVFSGVLTFSTLSLTVISMIIGMMDTNFSGFKLRELLKFESAPIRLARYVTMSALLCVAAIPALAFELCTLMTVIALSALIYTTYASILVFDLVSDPTAVRELVLQERKTEKQKNWEPYIGRWIKCYKEALQNAELEEVGHLSGLLAELIKEEGTRDPEMTPLRDAVSSQLLALLDAAAESMSFYEALVWSFDKLNLRQEKRAVCTEYLRRIRFMDVQQLLRFDLPGKLENLLAERYLDTDYDNQVICYEMIRGLNLNTAAGMVRDEILNECVRIMLSFSEEQESKTMCLDDYIKMSGKKRGNDKKKAVILMVFYNEIVMALEQHGETLYRELIQGLNPPFWAENSTALEIVAEMFYGWYQDAKVDKNRFERSKKMVSAAFDEKNIAAINLEKMVSFNELEIVEYYAKQSWMSNITYGTAVRAISGSQDIPGPTMCKGIRVAYRFYLASGIPEMCSLLNKYPGFYKLKDYVQYKDYHFPLLDCLEEQVQSKLLKIDCEALLEDFDPQTGEITAACMEDVLIMKELLGAGRGEEEIIRSYSSVSMIPVYQAITGYLKTFESGEAQK